MRQVPETESLTDPLVTAEAALAARPNDVQLRGQFGGLLLSIGQADRAIEVFREGLDQTTDDAGLLFGLSHAYARAGRGAEALDAAERAAALMPDDFHAQMHLSYLLSAAERLERAEAALTKAERLQSGDARVSAMLADVLARLGRTEEALAAAERAVVLAPHDETSIGYRNALRDRLEAPVEAASGPETTKLVADPVLEAPPPPPPAPKPAPKRGTFSFLGW